MNHVSYFTKLFLQLRVHKGQCGRRILNPILSGVINSRKIFVANQASVVLNLLMHILIIEDNLRVASFIKRGLREEHYAVDVASDGENGLFLAQSMEFDLIILDLLLPKRNGLDVLRALRKDGVKTPVLILTAKDALKDKVEGLDLGADDYLTKPFGFEELLARIRALIRRKTGFSSSAIKVADLEMDLVKHKVTRAGKEIVLTNREYALLQFFLNRAGHLVSRTALSEHVWEHDFDTFSNVIDVHIARLRRKIDDGFTGKLLKTIRGSGYILEAPNQK